MHKTMLRPLIVILVLGCVLPCYCQIKGIASIHFDRDTSGALLKATSIRCHFETGCYASWDQGQLGARITDEFAHLGVTYTAHGN